VHPGWHWRVTLQISGSCCNVLWHMSTTQYQFRQNRHVPMTMFHATNTGVNTYMCVSTEWFKQEGGHLSVAVENSRVDKLKQRAGQLLLLQKFSSLQISFQILMQTIRQATKGSYCFFSNGRPNTFCRLNSYSWTIWTERRRMSDLHKVVPTCKMHCNVHVTFANEQSSSSRTWQHCHTVVLSLAWRNKQSPAFSSQVCSSSSLKPFSKVQNIKVRNVQ
jgi:hypothetical protein